MADFVADHWREPDSGIWEVRDRPRHFVHSKAMAWVALDRACRLVGRLGFDGDVERWSNEARHLRAEVLERGVAAGRFRRAYDDDALDASLLMLPLVGFIAGDRRCRRPGLAPREGTTRPPAALPARVGRRSARRRGRLRHLQLLARRSVGPGRPRPEAEELFERLVRYVGDVGLLAEELDPATGAQLGNTPQAFTHIGLINAALRLRGACPSRTSAKGS